jgi:hypothetical protein
LNQSFGTKYVSLIGKMEWANEIIGDKEVQQKSKNGISGIAT